MLLLEYQNRDPGQSVPQPNCSPGSKRPTAWLEHTAIRQPEKRGNIEVCPLGSWLR
jgi:hypothetical protein